MSLDALYPWLKALHVAAAIAFSGGALAAAVLLAAAAAGTERAPSLAQAVRRWDLAVTVPAMLLTWAFGLTLAISGDWFADTWLQAKLVLVLVVSGLQGLQSGRLRRLASGATIPASRTAPIVLAWVIAIALLAVLKP